MKRIMTYILLRDNKEIGPLSLEELSSKGLRSHDLIWVEGQSVCWLNPEQINELKDLVGTSASSAVKPATSVEKNVIQVEQPFICEQEEETILVTDPAISAYMPVAEEKVFVKPVQASSKTENAAAAEIKYSQPLDELKELYAKTLEKRLKKKTFSVQIPPHVKKAGLYVGLLVAGIIAGVLINKGGKSKTNSPDLSTAYIDDRQKKGSDQSTTDEEDSNAIVEPLINTVPVNERYYPEESRYEERTHQPNDRQEQSAQPPVAKQLPSPEAEDKIEKAETKPGEINDRSLSELRSLVSVKSNNYVVGSFGGIRNLQLTVSNDSKYTLDQVVVELQYLKPRDEFLKSEHISFHGIGPNDSKTIAIPKSTRGVRVTCKILRVESKEMNNTTAGL
ncbi:MAG TPA: hypothetical protein VMZ03_12020 [Chitinophagaceae bacterium]|nr:hypothetical protein [Chitinophagaceae bacterium]